jgi:hypothetical protein
MTQPAPVPLPPSGDPAPAPTNPPTPAPPTTAPADPADQPLGPAGKKALDAEREARKELQKQLEALSPLQKLAAAMGAGTPAAGGKTEVELLNEKFATYESQLTEERTARWRAEVAAAKGLTPQQAARLQGSSIEEFTADADALAALFPTAPAGPRNPAPDPSQGARGGQPGPDLDARIAELKAKGDNWGAIALERSKLLTIKRPT